MAQDTAGGVQPPVPTSRLPVLLALTSVALGGLFLLNRADTQARDTIRKHHLEDLEHALYFARARHGTLPPYDQASWCGSLNDLANASVRAAIEEALRAQNEKYANPDKPFPTDPLADRSSPVALQRPPQPSAKDGTQGDRQFDYFYWKRNPAVFELYAILETDPTAERSTAACANSQALTYDYGITSLWRENP